LSIAPIAPRRGSAAGKPPTIQKNAPKKDRVLYENCFFIAGPTASGKSALALAVAEMTGAEIIGADAFQIYSGLEILTAAVSQADRSRIPHHLVGEISPAHSFDVGQYVSLATERIRSIQNRNRPVVIVGGTGLYLRALTHGLADLPPADQVLRAQLEQQSLEQLQEQLTGLDPTGSRWIDLKNPRRVIRAIEVCILTGKPFSSFREQWSTPKAGVRGVTLRCPREELSARINQRTEEMFSLGVIEEVRNLPRPGKTAAQVLGLAEIENHLQGGLSKAECIAAIQAATRNYAKRQVTWFARDSVLSPRETSGIESIGVLAREISAQLTPA
jgi:tRNA dimethylallyltransferase